jgi:hypothetical protein
MLRIGARTIWTPSGQEWRVGRRWISRRLPRWRKVRIGNTHKDKVGSADVAEAAFIIPDFGGIDDLGAAVLILAAFVVVAIIMVPLLLFGIELIVLGLLVAISIVGRTLLGRPWVVQATPANNDAGALTWRVVGWQRSGRLINEVAVSLEAGLDPTPAEATDLLPTA